MKGDIILQNFTAYFFSPIYQLVAVCTFVYFLYGVARFVLDLANSNPERETLGRSHLLWGLIGLFIIFSIGGILPWFNDFFGGMFKY